MDEERKNSTSWEHVQFSQHIEKCSADGALKRLKHLNEAAEAWNCQVCMWILESRFPEDFGRRWYRKINADSENKKENVEIIVTDADIIRKQILAKLAMVR